MGCVSIILIGHKGVGKTTFGKELGQRLRIPFIDTDQEMNKHFNGLSNKEIYQLIGKDAFRELEQNIILKIQPTKPSIISTGGGSLERLVNQEHLKKIGVFIFLKNPVEESLSYFLSNPVPGTKQEEIAELIQKRESLFLSLADKIITPPYGNHIKAIRELVS